MAVYADLIRYRELFASLFQRDLRAKYKGSALGLLWTLALPVILMLVYLLVFSVMWKSPTTDVDNYWLFLLCGLPPWVFFSSSLQSSARSLLENASLIRKVRFPRQIVPLSIVATQLVAFVVMTAIVLLLTLVFLPDSRWTAWLAIPIAAVIVLFVSGLSLAIASANAIYRDIEFVVTALLLPLFFLTPILYSLDNLPVADTHPWLIDVLQWGNPLTPVIECFRIAALRRRGAADGQPRLSRRRDGALARPRRVGLQLGRRSDRRGSVTAILPSKRPSEPA